MLRILEKIISDPKQDPDPETAEKDPDLKKILPDPQHCLKLSH
jgi:hypothetical protein